MAAKSCSSLRQKQGFVLGGWWCVLFFSSVPVFSGCLGYEKGASPAVAAESVCDYSGCGVGGSMPSPVGSELVGRWVKTWFCLVCLLLLEGEGRDFLLYPPPLARVPHSPESVPWRRLWRGGCTQKGHLGSEWQTWFAPARSPLQRGVREAAGASSASRAPRPSHSQTIGDLCSPPRRPHPRSPTASAAATSLFTRCRGSGVATSHVSKGPGAPGRTAPHGAGQR